MDVPQLMRPWQFKRHNPLERATLNIKSISMVALINWLCWRIAFSKSNNVGDFDLWSCRRIANSLIKNPVSGSFVLWTRWEIPNFALVFLNGLAFAIWSPHNCGCDTCFESVLTDCHTWAPIWGRRSLMWLNWPPNGTHMLDCVIT